MKNTADFLDALRVKLNVPSDYAVAKYMGMHRQHMSRYRKLHGTFDEVMCLKIADILETDPAYVVACMHYQREKNETVKKLWANMAARLAPACAAFAAAAIVPALIMSAPEAPQTLDLSASSIYIMRNSTGALRMRSPWVPPPLVCFSCLFLSLLAAAVSRILPAGNHPEAA